MSWRGSPATLGWTRGISCRSSSANRLSLRERVELLSNCFLLELVPPDTISERTYNMVDQAIQKYKQGEVSEPVDQEELDRLLNLSANRSDESSE